jgi:hypothetical protein
MRPALTVVVDERPIRLLADLADKPWAAEEGEPWKATFPYTIERADSGAAELTVAPDLNIALPAPMRRATAGRKSAPRRGDASRRPGLRRAGSGSSADVAFDRPDRPRRRSRSSAVGDERDVADSLMRELADLRDTQLRLRQRLDRAEAEKAKTGQRLDEVSGQLREVMHEREESDAARDRIAVELEAVRRERSEFVAEARRAGEAAGVARDRALSERGAALAAQRQAASERDVASAARDQAVAERNAALSLRDHALAERDAAAAARDEAVSARKALSHTTERLDSELADLLSARGAALVMRRAAQTPAVSRRYARIFPGTIAIAVVLAIVLIVVILLRLV